MSNALRVKSSIEESATNRELFIVVITWVLIHDMMVLVGRKKFMYLAVFLAYHILFKRKIKADRTILTWRNSLDPMLQRSSWCEGLTLIIDVLQYLCHRFLEDLQSKKICWSLFALNLQRIHQKAKWQPMVIRMSSVAILCCINLHMNKDLKGMISLLQMQDAQGKVLRGLDLNTNASLRIKILAEVQRMIY